MHRASCQASASGEQSAPHLDRRMQCLIRARLALSATIDVISRADDRAVESAPDTVAALPPVADCGDFVRLEQVVALPPDPAVRRAVARVEADLARVKALSDAGQLDLASDLVGPTLEAARAAGYPPVLARALLAAGRSAMGREPALAESRLREATRVAAGAGDATSEARAWVDLIETIGNQQGRVRDALALEHPASVAVGRVGSSLPAGALHLAIGMAHNVNGDQDEAIERYRQALPFAAGDPARLAAIHNNMGNAYRASGRDEQALEHLGLALEEYARSQHPGHTRVGIALINQSSILRRRGDLPGAVAALERARRIIESNAAAEGSVKVQLAEQMAAVESAQGHTDEAGRWHREALATARRVHGERHIAVAYSAENYAGFLAGEGRAREARELLALSIGIQEELFGPDSPKLAVSYANRGELEVEQRAWAEAIDDFSRVARLAGDRPAGVRGALELGKVFARTGRRREALAALSDGIARAERTGEDRTVPVASARLAAASLLWRAPETRARAREQAGAALAAFRHLGDEVRAAEAESWFRARGTRPTSSPP
jgi:tetratricopeptide (TPR) repeat protein